MKTDYELLGSGQCRWCRQPRRLSAATHAENCRSYDVYPPNHVHEIWPRIFLGVVEARVLPRFAAVIGVLSQANAVGR